MPTGTNTRKIPSTCAHATVTCTLKIPSTCAHTAVTCMPCTHKPTREHARSLSHLSPGQGMPWMSGGKLSPLGIKLGRQPSNRVPAFVPLPKVEGRNAAVESTSHGEAAPARGGRERLGAPMAPSVVCSFICWLQLRAGSACTDRVVAAGRGKGMIRISPACSGSSAAKATRWLPALAYCWPECQRG